MAYIPTDHPYAGAGAEKAYQSILSQVQGVHSDSPTARQNILDNITQAGDQFKSLFKNNVGRDATPDEIDQFFNGSASTLSNQDMRSGENLRNYTAQFIGDNFQQASQATATSKLSDLATQAGGLADQYMQMGQKSLSNIADSLKTYQTSLFDKLRPQLNLAAQAGGYQDSGGQTLQERGALTDLGNQATAALLPYQQQIEQNANAIRYGGASAPYSLASSFAAGQPGVLANTAAGGLNYGNNFQTNLNNQQLQLQLLNAQMNNSKDLWSSTVGSPWNNFQNTLAGFGGLGAAQIGNSGLANFGGNLAGGGGGGGGGKGGYIGGGGNPNVFPPV